MSAQDQTLQQYHQWMTVNATSHLIRSARQVGFLDELRAGQRTLDQLCDARSLRTESAERLLDALVAIGFIEKYGDDYALSRAAFLLCQYDDDLSDRRWEKLTDLVQGKRSRGENDDWQRFDRIAATQWIHTPAAIQAAEILDIGGEGKPQGISILDLGCGSAVWSCAMAHRDPAATITAVDRAAALQAAQTTADSIDLNDRFQTIDSPPMELKLQEAGFDLVLIAQRLSCLSDDEATRWLRKAVAACKPGGQVVVIDLFRGPTKPTLVESIEALTLELETRGGRIRSLEEAQKLLGEAGLEKIQFTFLAASQQNLGMALAQRPQ